MATVTVAVTLTQVNTDGDIVILHGTVEGIECVARSHVADVPPTGRGAWALSQLAQQNSMLALPKLTFPGLPISGNVNVEI